MAQLVNRDYKCAVNLSAEILINALKLWWTVTGVFFHKTTSTVLCIFCYKNMPWKPWLWLYNFCNLDLLLNYLRPQYPYRSVVTKVDIYRNALEKGCFRKCCCRFVRDLASCCDNCDRVSCPPVPVGIMLQKPVEQRCFSCLAVCYQQAKTSHVESPFHLQSSDCLLWFLCTVFLYIFYIPTVDFLTS